MNNLQVLALSTLVMCGWTHELPCLLALNRRQDVEPGTPLYECHANCGYAILTSETQGYCSNSSFTSELDACLECALTYDIWQYYGNEVADAASACGDSAIPRPSSALSVVVSTESPAAGTAVTATDSSTVFPTTTQSSPAASETFSSTATGTEFAFSSTSAAPSQFTGAASILVDKSNWFLLLGLTMIGLL